MPDKQCWINIITVPACYLYKLILLMNEEMLQLELERSKEKTDGLISSGSILVQIIEYSSQFEHKFQQLN